MDNNNNNNKIEIKVTADTSDLEKSIDSATKKVDKQADKMEKSFNDLSKSLNKVKANMNNAFNSNNTNLNGLTNQLNKLTNVANSVASKVQSALKKAFNVEGKITVKQDVQTTNTTTNANSNGGALANALLSGGAIGSQISKELAQGMKQGVEQAQEIFAKGLQGVKSEAETLSMVFDGIDDSLIEQMSNIKAEVEPMMQLINSSMAEMMEENEEFEPFDTNDFSKNLLIAKSYMEDLEAEFEGLDQGLQLSKEGLIEFKTNLHTTAGTIDDLCFGLSDTAKELDKLTRPGRGINVPLKPEDIEYARELLQQMNSEINNLQDNVNKINFIDNFDTTQLISSLEKFEQAQTKTNAQPLINELERMQDEANKVGISIKGVDDVLQQYSQIDANATKLTAEFRDSLVGVCQQFKAYNAQVQANAQAQALMRQRQAEINRHSTTLGQTLVKAKHHLQDFGTALKQAFSGGVQKAGQYIDNLKNKTKQLADAHKQAADKIKSANAGIMASFKGLLATITPFLTIIGAFNLFKQSTTQAMESLESNNMYMAVFGNNASQMDKWIKSVNQSMGLGVNNTKQYTAIIQQMGSAMGLTSDEAMSMSKSMAVMAGDISSFYNVPIAQAQEDLRSALSGSNEVLTKYGIVLREDTIKQFAYANGIAAMGSELTAAQRAMTLTMMVEQQLGQANNDMVKTLQSPSNQLRILKTNLQELKVALGQCFLPVIQVILPLANKLIQVLTVVTQKIADCISDLFALFGVNISTGGGGGVVSDTFSDVADSSGVIADNFGEASKDAKEMAKSLASFDKLNVLNSNKSSSSSSNSGSTGGIPTIGGSMGGNTSSNTASEVTKGISEWAQQIHDAIVNNPYFKSLKQSFFGLVDACRNFIKSAGGWLKLFMDSGGRDFLNNLGDCALIIGDILVTALKDGVTWVTNFLNSAKGQAVIRTLGELCKWLSERLKDILLWIRDNKDMLYKLIGVVATVKLGFAAFIKVAQGISAIKTGVGLVKTALGKLPAILKGIKGGWETMRIAGMLALDKIKLALPGVLSGAKSMLSGAVSAVGSAITAVAGAMGISAGALVAIIAGVIAALTLIILNWDKVKEWGIKAWNGIKSAWSASNQWCYNNIVSPIINHFRNMWNTARDLGQRAWDGIKNTWQGMNSWYGSLGQRVSQHFSNMWNSIRNGGQNAWQYLQRVFNSGGSFFRDITSSMGNAFKQVLNMAIRGINNIIGIPFRGINSAIRSLKNTSILGARPFQFLRELNVPQIPYLAKGGIVDSATLAMIGEGRQNEAVIPLDTFYSRLSQMFAEQNRMLLQNMQNGGNTTIVLQLDGKEVARGTVKNMREMSKLGQLDMTWL